MLQVRNIDRKHEGEKMARYLLELDMRLLTITFKMLHSYKLGTISDQKEKNPVKQKNQKSTIH